MGWTCINCGFYGSKAEHDAIFKGHHNHDDFLAYVEKRKAGIPVAPTAPAPAPTPAENAANERENAIKALVARYDRQSLAMLYEEVSGHKVGRRMTEREIAELLYDNQKRTEKN